MAAAFAVVIIVVAFCATAIASYVVEAPTWVAAISFAVAVLGALVLIVAVADASTRGRSE